MFLFYIFFSEFFIFFFISNKFICANDRYYFKYESQSSVIQCDNDVQIYCENILMTNKYFFCSQICFLPNVSPVPVVISASKMADCSELSVKTCALGYSLQLLFSNFLIIYFLFLFIYLFKRIKFDATIAKRQCCQVAARLKHNQTGYPRVDLR